VSIVVVATIRPVAEHREDVIAILENAIDQVHAEPGCERYALHEARDHLVMIEKWESGDALKVHAAAPALVELRSKLEGKLVGPIEATMLRPHPAGSAGLGAI
jgi:quinol monooxygenase YgiN